MTLQDARYRTKVWLEEYLDKDALTMDNDATKVKFAVLFAGFPYPIQREFYSMDLLYIIGEPVTTALYNLSSKEVYGYSEQLPVSIGCLDKSGITATKLKLKAENEFRRICENYPWGSLRLMDRRRDTTQKLGAATYLQTELTLAYKRASDTSPVLPTFTWGNVTGDYGEDYWWYIFPNCVNIEYENRVPDAKTHPPGYVGNIKNPMGGNPLKIKITCDLDCEPDALTWKRPQATTPKTDDVKWQVILDIDHNGAISQDYQTLALDWGSFPVRLVDYRVYQQGNDNFLEVAFEEYTAASKADKTLAQRYNIV